MSRNIICIVFVSIMLSFCGCLKYETQFEGPYEDPEIDNEATLPKVLVFVATGTVYLANEYFEDITIVDEGGNIKWASINHNHTKVLFKRFNENIQIYNIASETVVDEVPNSDQATWFDFHANNETVYYNDGWMLHTYGPAVLLNNPTNLQELSPVSGFSVALRGLAVYANGNIVYSVSTPSTGSRLYLTDGVSNIADDVWAEYRADLRLSKDETEIWATNQYGNRLIIHNALDMSEMEFDYDFKFGAPTSQTNGYKVTFDDEWIALPPGLLGNTIFERKAPDDKEFEAVDY